MVDLEFTKEERDALKKYINEDYEAINQLLVSNCETDIALLSDEVENKVVKISYDRTSVIENLMSTKTLYRLFMKNFYKTKHKKEKFFRGTNLAEIERLKMEPFIDRIWSATTDEKKEENFASVWNRPVGINITLEENVPFINVGKILNSKKDNDFILIAPFTKIKSIEECKEKNLEDSKYFKYYNITLEKQELDKLTDRERNGLYNYILENCYSIKRKLEDCIKLEKENAINFDNIRKMEQLLRKYETSIDEKESDKEYSDIDRTADYNDVERVSKELNELKKISTNVFELRKENIDFVNMWKRNIAVYMIAECKEIEKNFDSLEIIYDDTSEELQEEIVNKKDEEEKKEEVAEEVKEEKSGVIQDTIVVDEKIPVTVTAPNEEKDEEDLSNSNSDNSDENKEEIEESEKEDNFDDTKVVDIKDAELEKEENEEETKTEEVEYNEVQKRVKTESKENVEAVQKLIDDIKLLISKQQNHAKIAGNIGSSYSALNNAFEMKKSAEALKELVDKIDNKVYELCLKDFNDRVELDLEIISKTNIEISTLLNYLNNPKIAVKNSKISRFDEIAIIEENELKKGIAEKVREIMGEAELKKLKDDLEIIEEKGRFSRFIGLFTGRNKIDDFMIEQIEYRQMIIRRALSKKLSLARNYSIHEIVALIDMFIKDNEDDELVVDDVKSLKELTEELKRNYIVLDSKVQSIVEKKEGRNLPYDNKKMTKQEMIEVETYRFLNKYGYDIPTNPMEEEPKYQDTMTSEISRIIEYVNSSNIL